MGRKANVEVGLKRMRREKLLKVFNDEFCRCGVVWCGVEWCGVFLFFLPFILVFLLCVSYDAHLQQHSLHFVPFSQR